MKPAPFHYHRAETLDEATDMLATLGDARILAGGQSLMPMMNMRYAAFDHLIDINPIDELSGISFDGDTLTLGAMTRQRTVLEDEAVFARAPVIREALGYVGHLQTRNRGTVGGSLVHMDPAAEMMGLAALMDARLNVRSAAGSRQVPMAEFLIAYMTPALEPDEILCSVELALWPQGAGWDFREFAQRHGDFAVVGVGSLLSLDDTGAIARAAVALIGVGDGPLRLAAVEEMLVGKTPGDDLFRAAAEAAGAPAMLSDALISEAYRQHLARVLVRRSLEAASARAGGGHAR